jgi:hypothetical protein
MGEALQVQQEGFSGGPRCTKRAVSFSSPCSACLDVLLVPHFVNDRSLPHTMWVQVPV